MTSSATQFMADGAPFTLEEVEAHPPEYSDDALALAFSSRHHDQLLYVPAWASWLRWDGTRWAKDDTLAVFSLARELCRAKAVDALLTEVKERTRLARGLTSASTVAAVERLARSDHRHARPPEAFDSDPRALNTPNGVIDLRTGLMRPHRRSDLVTKVTAVAPAGTCRRWIRFLLEITYGNRDLVRYLQRLIGYTLTGVISEHCFAFLWGPGGNGKSVLLSTVAAMLGDYATTSMADVFTVTHTDHHPTHLANLRGARMVVVAETEEGRPWAEARIKSLTGGDRITARVTRRPV
jgi:putative DNA primase/helicase